MDAKGQRKGNAGSGKALNLAQLSDFPRAVGKCEKMWKSVGVEQDPACGQSHFPEQVKNAAQKPMNSRFLVGRCVSIWGFFFCVQAVER